MRPLVSGLFLGAAGLAACLLSPPPGGGRESAGPPRQAGGGGWVDLLPGAGLKGWRRVPIAPDTKLTARDPWRVDAPTRTLVCDGVGVKEMLLHEREFGDGVFHVEWRFRKVADRADYNGGVYVRTALDGRVWHQAQVAHSEKPPRLGDLFGETLVDGKPRRFLVEGRGWKLARPPGEWNTYEVTCKGPAVRVEVNGAAATAWDGCKVLRGHVGLQAEYFDIEYKGLKFRPLR